MTLYELQELYDYVDSCLWDISDLGHHYSSMKTSFSVFAPTTQRMSVVLDQEKTVVMEKKGDCFYGEVSGDWEGHLYHFRNGRGECFADPFSYADSDDGRDSYILDKEKFKRKKIPLPKREETIIYEISIRDFSSSLPCAHPKTFKALTEEGLEVRGKCAGIDYLKELGITHVQIMPVFSFDDDIKHGKDYNWGYNPVSYSTFKRSYLVDHKDPYAGVTEFQEMVEKLHEKGIGVILDVVFNHVYDLKANALNKMIPYYFFRYKENMRPAEGTFCGNEVRSEGAFTRAYFKEIVRRYIEIYDIDGLRFDLMGIMDCETIRRIRDLSLSLKKDFLLYGEAWNMGDVLDEDERASEDNLSKIYPVGAFNRFFRDPVTAFSLRKGVDRKEIEDALMGSPGNGFTPEQSISYVECHDNMTFYDRAREVSRDEKELGKMCRFAMGMVMLGKGIPFLHSGQEFLRSKAGLDNSYNIGDHINTLDWVRRGLYENDVEYFRKLVKIRKAYAGNFKKEVKFEEHDELLICRYGDLLILINPCTIDHIYTDSRAYEILLDGEGNEGERSREIRVPAYTIVVARTL